MEHKELEQVLRRCSYHVLELLLCQALGKSGYGDVQIMGRRHTRQKSRHGGFEILCEAVFGKRTIRTIVKLVNQDARLRNMDELAGALIRTGADSGLLVTPFGLSRAIAPHLERYAQHRIAPLDGRYLAIWLRDLGIGLRKDGSPDYRYLAHLEEASGRVLDFMKEASNE